MHSRSFWVLDDADGRLVARLAAGLGRTAARVLAYLLLRAERESDPTTTVHLRIGTGCNRPAISDATARLEALDLLERSSVRDDDAAPGRPQTAWQPTAGVEPTVRRVYDRHGQALLEQAAACHTNGAANGEDGDGDGNGAESPDGSEQLDADGTDAGDHPLVTLAVNWRPNALHAPIYAALEAGWYETFGVDLRVDHCDGSRRALERVRSGAADVGIAGAATVVRARAADEPVVPIAVCYQRAMTVLYTLREVFGEPFRSVAQLEGRRIGMPPSSETRLLGRLFLSQTALGDGVRIVDTNGEERDALRRGDADVVTGSFSDPRALERRGERVDVLPLADHFPIYGPTLIVREEAFAERRPALRGMLAGTTAGWVAAQQDAGPAAERIAARRDEDRPDARSEDDESTARIEAEFAEAAAEFGGSDAVAEHGWGWQREAMWDRLRTALAQADLLAEP
ncbi:ABC transporter substrate-binding protein [Halopiger xanaduensis]|uniref:Thiamine pyrimidine synthase n=1 Tax=Halopiger xanaduensis (strain DSM 18323 / JCM 14033 / SH-6) TaxID=797210 RepID=F8D7N8_HALXS|nr:ABC transporter substrate-binding protein [Halopiger xanaduensis]AEH35486.1 NMT1/THI5 like domain protein [Halopiger xanaduensis SH-6]